jgi:AbrB family looped-hinge helix DNA binding protein
MKKGLAQCGNFEMFGTTTSGERGQVVIPAAARKHFNIKKGEQFLVVSGGPHDDFIGLVPMRSLNKLVTKVKSFTERLESQLENIKE